MGAEVSAELFWMGVAVITGFSSKVMFDWMKGNKNTNGKHMPEECRVKIDDVIRGTDKLLDLHIRTEGAIDKINLTERACAEISDMSKQLISIITEGNIYLKNMSETLKENGRLLESIKSNGKH